jgi:pimeloyl-ACP methyl ester carboxylesterase
VGDTIELPDGRRAQWWLGGADAGPLVGFLRGCPDTRHAAMTGHDAARDVGVRLLCVNRPGYGASDVYESTQTSVADDLMAVADAVGADQLALLEMSIGGSYAVTAAAAHPDRVRALGLVATQFGRSEPGSAAGAREALAQHDGYLRDAALAFRDWDRRPEDLGCPTHLWYGELDTAAPLAEGEELARLIPGSSLVVRPGTTHLATLMAHWHDILATLRAHLD